MALTCKGGCVAVVGEVGGLANAAQAERWNGDSGRYWIAHRERHLAEHERLLPHLFGAARISPGERVLDVGCGCGATTITAARAATGAGQSGAADPGPAGAAGAAVGVDLSGPMLDVAGRLAAQSGVPNVRFVRGDAQACPLRAASFDMVISSFGIMFFDDPVTAFANIAGALRPGGRLAFLCWQPEMANEVFSIPLRAFAVSAHPLRSPSGDLFTDPRQITLLLARTGWADIEVSPVSEPAWLGPGVDDVMSYVRGMPLIRSLAASAGDEALASRALTDIARQYAARQQPGGIWVRAAAWLVTARRA